MLTVLPEPLLESGLFKARRTISGASTLPSEGAAGFDSEEDDLDSLPYMRLHLTSLDYGVLPSPISTAYTLMKSDLRLWAEEVVAAEELIKSECCTPWGSERARREFLVDNTTLQAATIGLAYRRSKHLCDRDLAVPGPAWGVMVSGVDHGDGWLEVGEHFLPMVLKGCSVLIPKAAGAPTWPALTVNGRTVDLHGRSVVFPVGDEATQSTKSNQSLKEKIRMARVARLAQAAREAAMNIAAGRALAVDSAGEVHGSLAEISRQTAQGSHALKQRMRKVRDCLRRRRGISSVGSDCPGTICIGADGKCFLFLKLGDPVAEAAAAAAERCRRRRAAMLRPACAEEQGGIMVVDGDGVVHDW